MFSYKLAFAVLVVVNVSVAAFVYSAINNAKRAQGLVMKFITTINRKLQLAMIARQRTLMDVKNELERLELDSSLRVMYRETEGISNQDLALAMNEHKSDPSSRWGYNRHGLLLNTTHGNILFRRRLTTQ